VSDDGYRSRVGRRRAAGWPQGRSAKTRN
jgi:hypothetical protein